MFANLANCYNTSWLANLPEPFDLVSYLLDMWEWGGKLWERSGGKMIEFDAWKAFSHPEDETIPSE